MANDPGERSRWIDVLSHLIREKSSGGNNPDWTKDDEKIKAHFLKADKDNGKTIDGSEIEAFLESMNLKLKREQINTLMNVSED